jgi:hypothetical protein
MCPGSSCRDLLHGVLAGAISSSLVCGMEEALVNEGAIFCSPSKTLPDLETASETFSSRKCVGAGDGDGSTSNTHLFVLPALMHWKTSFLDLRRLTIDGDAKEGRPDVPSGGWIDSLITHIITVIWPHS